MPSLTTDSDVDLFWQAKTKEGMRQALGEEFLFGVYLTGLDDDLTLAELANFPCPKKCRVTRVFIGLKTAPTGSAAAFDVEDDGTSIFAAVLSVSAAAKYGEKEGSTVFASSSAYYDFNKGDLVTVDCNQIGSTVAGAGAFIIFFGSPLA